MTEQISLGKFLQEQEKERANKIFKNTQDALLHWIDGYLICVYGISPVFDKLIDDFEKGVRATTIAKKAKLERNEG